MARAPKITVYRDVLGDWRWRYVAANGQTLAGSSEGYVRRIDCVRAMAAVCGTSYECRNRLRTPDGGIYEQGRMWRGAYSHVFVEVVP
ncbi:YegP family protein [Luteipulveratus mongoliensis]|uniref:DUF1508 domain-containing protein n=1 Tax=Luteipulveratus mongoliensis TaxID=571913 RepID=A0A0K1JGQ9_9MICO|nr:DUF1508 domain-containing protein [Luteipulveratus mongoliensis]AKU15770.1 hypothetical protein VV02_07740 [Luteipulveratus mongoliensis]